MTPKEFDEFLKRVVDATGDRTLPSATNKIFEDRDSLLVLIDQKSGLDQAEEELSKQELALEQELKSKEQEREAKLEVLDHLGKANVAEGVLSYIRLKKSIRKIDEIAREAGVLGPAVGESNDIQEYEQTSRAVHDQYIRSFRRAVQQLRKPLSGYRMKRRLWRWVPRVASLIASFLIFAIGAGTLVEGIHRLQLKLGFVIVIWAVEKLGFEPVVEKFALRYRHAKIREITTYFYNLKAWALHQTAFLDYHLEKEIQKLKANRPSEQTQPAHNLLDLE